MSKSPSLVSNFDKAAGDVKRKETMNGIASWLARERRILLWSICCAWGLQFLSPAKADQEKTFPTPDQAVTALVAAAKAKDTNGLTAIFGPTSPELASADSVQAGEAFAIFIQRLNEKVQQTNQSDSRIELQLGEDGWPFPIPLVKENGHWFFDTEAGAQEIVNRRIGQNELGAIQVCRAYVEAQREYAGRDRNGDDVLAYAQHLRSTPGTHDGLYWPMQPGQDLSPLGPLIAAARVEGYRREKKILGEEQSPYHGYYFKILTRQGKHAAGGKYDYIINGHMIGGFALVAWPAQWDNTGIMTFIVNQNGKVYQKNLGVKTASIAEEMTIYDPDESWAVVRE